MATPATHIAARIALLRKLFPDDFSFNLALAAQYVLDSDNFYHFYHKLDKLTQKDDSPLHTAGIFLVLKCMRTPGLEPLRTMVYHLMDDHTWHTKVIDQLTVETVRDNRILYDLGHNGFDISHLLIESGINEILTEDDTSINAALLGSLDVARQVAPAFAYILSEYFGIHQKYFAHSLQLSSLVLEYDARNGGTINEWQIRGAVSDGNHGKLRNFAYEGIKPLIPLLPVNGTFAEYLSPKIISALANASSAITLDRISDGSLDTLISDTKDRIRRFDRKNKDKLKVVKLADSPLPYIMTLPTLHEKESLDAVLSGRGGYGVSYPVN